MVKVMSFFGSVCVCVSRFSLSEILWLVFKFKWIWNKSFVDFKTPQCMISNTYSGLFETKCNCMDCEHQYTNTDTGLFQMQYLVSACTYFLPLSVHFKSRWKERSRLPDLSKYMWFLEEGFNAETLRLNKTRAETGDGDSVMVYVSAWLGGGLNATGFSDTSISNWSFF